MLLILSARFVSEDIGLHYGRLPPSFLPLGAQRLFSLQAEQAAGQPVFMTVPEDFVIPQVDLDAITAAGITLLPQPGHLSLTHAISAALQAANQPGPLRLLYGDTLVRPHRDPTAALTEDRVMVQTTSSNYPWAYVVETQTGPVFSNTPPDHLGDRRVVCGDYTFTDQDLLLRACQERTIIDALNAYQAVRPFAFVDAEDWLDFGHLPLYFQSKKSIMIKRVFNSLSYENHQLTKLSDDTAKIRAEANWYENIPPSLQVHIPRYSGRVARSGRAGYAVEYLYHPLLSDLAVFGALPLPSWLEILEACFEFFDKCHQLHPEPEAPEATAAFADEMYQHIFLGKTWQRLEAYCATAGLSLDDAVTLNGQQMDSLRAVVTRTMARVPATRRDHIRFWHGDAFFGNMFYDFTARRILAIDPRGQLSTGQMSLYGDWRYDIAKLAHSVIGHYDSIILGRAALHETSPLHWDLRFDIPADHTKIADIFQEQVTKRYGLAKDELTAMTALLFFSMLPLHSDQPHLQRQMLANALRLAAISEGQTL